MALDRFSAMLRDVMGCPESGGSKRWRRKEWSFLETVESFYSSYDGDGDDGDETGDQIESLFPLFPASTHCKSANAAQDDVQQRHV